MKIALLSRKPTAYSTRRLLEAGKARGHEMCLLDTLRCHMNITSAPNIHYLGTPLPHVDAIIPRISPHISFYGAAVVRQFEAMGTFSLNCAAGIMRSRDKLRSLQLLSRKGIDLPITGFAHSPSDIDDLIKMVGGPPLVIKLLEGTQGVGVVLAETKKAAASVMQALFWIKEYIIVQEYVAEAHGADIRCFVLGNKVIASMKRQAQAGEFRSNLHRGGIATPITITKEERRIALAAAKIMGLKMAGVDILRSKRGPLVMEVNSSPGLEGIETITQQDIATQIIEYIEQHAGLPARQPKNKPI